MSDQKDKPEERALIKGDEAIFSEFVQTGKDLATLSREFGIPQENLLKRAKDEKWVDHRSDHIKELQRRANEEYERFIAANKLIVADEHLESVQKMHETMMKIINKIDPDAKYAGADLERMSRAAKNVADIGAKLVALDSREREDNRPGVRQPLIVLNVRPRESQKESRESEKDIIDIDVVESD